MENRLPLGIQEALSFEEALTLMVEWLLARMAEAGRLPAGLRVSPRAVVQQHLSDAHRVEIDRFMKERERPQVEFDFEANTEVFFDVAWELVRRGILIPSGRYRKDGKFSAQPDEFKVTSHGEAWLAGYPGHVVYPFQHDRFSAHLADHTRRFGESYELRTQEALACYRAQLYLACCAMCGAAAESILLTLASERLGSRDAALREYQKASGAAKILNALTVGQNGYVKDQLEAVFSLLKHWRDVSAHATDTTVGEETAFLALLLLLRFAQFADGRWDEITARASGGSP